MKHRLSKRLRRHTHIRIKISGTSEIPRVSVYRSAKRIYVQFIDDQKKHTLIGMSDSYISEKNNLTKANLMGKEIAEKASVLKIKKVVFDRSGYAYHGRIKALAEGLREGGLQF